MPQTFEGKPRKLRNGEWGASLPKGSQPEPGDIINITTREGLEFQKIVGKVVSESATYGLLVSTTNVPLPAAEPSQTSKPAATAPARSRRSRASEPASPARNTYQGTRRTVGDSDIMGVYLPEGSKPTKGDHVVLTTPDGDAYISVVDRVVGEMQTGGVWVQTSYLSDDDKQIAENARASAGTSAATEPESPPARRESQPDDTPGDSRTIHGTRVTVEMAKKRGLSAVGIYVPKDSEPKLGDHVVLTRPDGKEHTRVITKVMPGETRAEDVRVVSEFVSVDDAKTADRAEAASDSMPVPAVQEQRTRDTQARRERLQSGTEEMAMPPSPVKPMPSNPTDMDTQLDGLLKDVEWPSYRKIVVNTVDRGPMSIQIGDVMRPYMSLHIYNWYNSDPGEAEKSLERRGIRAIPNPYNPKQMDIHAWTPAKKEDVQTNRDVGTWHYGEARRMAKEETSRYNADHVAESHATEAPKGFNPKKPDRDDPRTGQPMDYFPYQKAGIKSALDRQNILIADEPGLGKTAQALGVINNDPSMKRVLVICPATIRDNWLKEANTWLVNKPKYMCKVNSGTGTKGCVPKRGAAFVVTNYEAMRDNSTIAQEIRDGKWDMVILDEAHKLKNPSAQQTQGIFGRNASTDRKTGETKAAIEPLEAKRKLALTGTPVTKNPMDVYGVISWLQPEQFPDHYVGRSMYRERYDDTNNQHSNTNVRNEKELESVLRSTVMVRRESDEVRHDRPDKTRRVVMVEPQTTAEKKAVRAGEAFEKKYGSIVDLLDNGRSDLGHKQTVWLPELTKVIMQMAEAKSPMVAQYVADAAEEGEPLVYFGWHKVTVDAVAKKLDKEGIPYVKLTDDVPIDKRQAIVDKFQDPDNPSAEVLIATMGVASEGLNMYRARRAIFGELNWSADKMAQAEMRIDRIGQKNDMLVEHLVLGDSMDANLSEVVSRKMDTMKAVVGVSNSNMVNRSSPKRRQTETTTLAKEDRKPVRRASKPKATAKKTPAKKVTTKASTSRAKANPTPVITEKKPTTRKATTPSADAENEKGLLRGNRRTTGRGKKDEKDKGGTRKVNITVT